MKNSEPTLSPQLSLSPPDVPPPEPLPEVTEPGSQSSLRKRSTEKIRLTFQHFKEKLHGNRESLDTCTSERRGGELHGSERRGSQLNGSGRRGSDSPKGERRTSRFAEWRKKSFGAGIKRRSSEQVSPASSQHKTESLKLLRGMFSFKKTASIDEAPLVDPQGA